MLYNEFRSAFGGEDKVVSEMMSIFRDNRVEVVLETRSSKNMGLWGKVEAFFGGVFNPRSYAQVRRLLREMRPDLVHVHNLYPLFSPSVLVACRKEGVPVVMTLHNFALTCPHWSHFRDGTICELCAHGNNLWCVAHNCQKNIAESVGYALRATAADRFGWFRNHVDRFIGLTGFAKERLVAAGYPADRIAVFPNPVETTSRRARVRDGRYVAFAGRMSEEKGIDCLLAAARLLPDVPFGLAGDGPLFGAAQAEATANVTFFGRLTGEELAPFYENARMLVVPSTCFEMCPTVILEGMALGLPIVASRTGGLPELVEHERTGLLFERANPDDLAAQVQRLWSDLGMAEEMGGSGRTWVAEQCDKAVYFERLMGVYRDATASKPTP